VAGFLIALGWYLIPGLVWPVLVVKSVRGSGLSTGSFLTNNPWDRAERRDVRDFVLWMGAGRITRSGPSSWRRIRTSSDAYMLTPASGNTRPCCQVRISATGLLLNHESMLTSGVD
jgi:hypothetical protein